MNGNGTLDGCERMKNDGEERDEFKRIFSGDVELLVVALFLEISFLCQRSHMLPISAFDFCRRHHLLTIEKEEY